VGLEVDQEVDVTLARAVVVTQRGTEDIETGHPVADAQLDDRFALVLQSFDHDDHLRHHATRLCRDWPHRMTTDPRPTSG
jgi:hypothetical protein